MRLYYFKNAEDLARQIAGALGLDAKLVEERDFPDGEVLVRVEPAREAILLARLYPDVNKNLVKLFLALDALSDYGADRVVLVAPYLPYARQDRRFRDGEPISVKFLLSHLRQYPVSHLIAVDLHKPYIGDYVAGLRVVNVYPAEKYAAAVRRWSVDVVLSPDAGSLHRAAALAELLGVPYNYFEKFRDRETGEIYMKPRGDVSLQGKSVVLVDDILATGGTLVDACKNAKLLGASAVYAVVSHCQLLGNAREKIKGCVNALYCTNTIPCEYSSLDVSEDLAKSISAIL
ncbi:ribose-phosphate pyrophosphokinase [Thermoproteus uzoniensis 768-20]|uniref:ribose-phosphate diphosphokinase n=1 Tax=Thermoproteus uzoniensis (strain 768-20) TaxID=999630 RepID=F2L4I5_THEU7|nr:ribose-phosphate diphosphokinase [Thermoproteus uzoniensis]AEA12163.1 ribose-phosphate pyrophosphokinase [Thermoproteus uzoniensis 768-20]